MSMKTMVVKTNLFKTGTRPGKGEEFWDSMARTKIGSRIVVFHDDGSMKLPFEIC